MNVFTRQFILIRARLWRFLGNSPGPSDEWELSRWRRGRRRAKIASTLGYSGEDRIFRALLDMGAAASGNDALRAWRALEYEVMFNMHSIDPLVKSGRLNGYELMELGRACDYYPRLYNYVSRDSIRLLSPWREVMEEIAWEEGEVDQA